MQVGAMMRLTKQDRAFATLGLLPASALATAAGGHLQNWLGLPLARTIVLLALLAAPSACMHGILLVAVALARRGVQPMVWLLGKSRYAMWVLLHLAAAATFVVGLLLGFGLDSDFVLAVTTLLVLASVLAVEWTFRAEMGPLAHFLQDRQQQYLERSDGS